MSTEALDRRVAIKRRNAAGEGGAALLLALASLMLVSVVAVGVAAFSQTVSKATVTTIRTQDTIRTIDGYLEKAVKDYRLDPAAVGVSCAGRWSSNPSWLPSGYSLVCTNELPSSPPLTSWRRATIELRRGTRAVGLAKVRVDDMSGSSSVPGATLTVCAWQLADVSTSTAGSC